MPANEPYRRFDENGNYQPPPKDAGFYAKYPQYAQVRFYNPKGHPDGDRTEAGRAYDNWLRSQGRLQTTRTKPKKRGRGGAGSSSQSDFMAKGPGAAIAAENAMRSNFSRNQATDVRTRQAQQKARRQAKEEKRAARKSRMAGDALRE